MQKTALMHSKMSWETEGCVWPCSDSVSESRFLSSTQSYSYIGWLCAWLHCYRYLALINIVSNSYKSIGSSLYIFILTLTVRKPKTLSNSLQFFAKTTSQSVKKGFRFQEDVETSLQVTS